MSSITTTSATVSWTPYSGAGFTYLHYKVQGAPSESTIAVFGSSYNLTGLLPCKTYEVRLRSACGSVTVSDYTTSASFNTASTNPTVSISAEMIDNGCTGMMATPEAGFVSYVWTKTGSSVTQTIDNDTTGLLIKEPGTYHVTATTAAGCTATASLTIPSSMFVSGCITDAHNQLMKDTFDVKSAQLTSDMNLLAKSFAVLKNNSTVRGQIKALANADPNFHVKISDLSAACTANGLNLKSELKTALKNNGASNADTARIASIMNDFAYNFPSGTPATTFYPSIYFHHLDPDNIGDVSGSWDTLNVTYVVPTMGNHISPYSAYSLSAGILTNTNIPITTVRNTPHWQIVINTDHPNDSGVDPTAGPLAGCSCYTVSLGTGGSVSSCGGGRGGCNGLREPVRNGCGGNCNLLQRIVSWIVN